MKFGALWAPTCRACSEMPGHPDTQKAVQRVLALSVAYDW